MMKITPLEIRQKTFEKVFRGYDKDEVDAYLQSLSMEWERMLDENKELYHRIEGLETESKKLRELESSLYKTLKTAEDTGATLIEQAKKETELQIKESSFKAESILNDARNKAKGLVENAESRKRQILDEMINNVRKMESLFNQMTDLKEKVAGQVKNYSTDLMERIEKLEKKSEDIHIHDVVDEARKIYNSSVVGEEQEDIKEENDEGKGGSKVQKPSKKGKEKEEDKKMETVQKVKVKDDTGKDFGNMAHSGKDPAEKTIKQDSEQENSEENFSWAIEKEEEAGEKEPEEHSELGVEEKKKESKSTSKSFFDEID
jgi:cell division initiation protein